MALVNRSFSVNVTPGMMPPIVHVSEYDVGRAYTVSILDEQGNTFTIPSGTTASIEGTLNGAVGFTQSATVSNNQVSFTLSQSMTAYSGKAWCKIKLTQNSQPIQTCAFVLAVDRAGVEADTILHSPGFQEQINEGIAEYFDNDPPFFELPSGGQSGQALLSDGANGAYWGQAQGGGSGLTEDVKQALLACFENVAWINDQGQTYYDALNDALYPPADLSSISAVFDPQSHIVYVGDSLDSLKPYLTVTAHYSDQSTRAVSDYLLAGTLAEGTSVVTVTYGGKTTTINVTVIAKEWESGVPYKNIQIVPGEWPQTQTGVMNTNSSTWSRSDYVPCAGAKRIYFPRINSASNWFYDANYEPLPRPGNTPNFPLYTAQTYNVPEGAAYFVISGANAEIAAYFVDYDCIPYDSY